MITYISQRLVQAIPVLVGISILSFLLLHLVPGDPVQIFAGDKPLTPERAAELRHAYGLDRPLVGLCFARAPWRPWRCIAQPTTGPDSILEALPSTAQLTLTALAIAAV